MNFIPILIVLSFFTPAISASLLVPPTVTPTATTTISASAASTSSQSREGSSKGSREKIQATRTIGMDEGVPVITAAPMIDEIQLQEKYHQTTYWSCVTRRTYVHCGWHEPVLVGGTEIAGAQCGLCNNGGMALMAAGVVVAVGVL
ncbi:fb107956-5df3-4973-ab06-60e4b95a763e [Sclerotinia trifoliorum]|uniref:Fb107956-5df3-4973-ab06-60e4b95a763e n=1 Tax=Sclerotinia trifoliorum TaxID=28548 RepID=A0A8H2VM74_9HELO|nr:fb107956-5df3-4973-ab06-60e4b95a763e [Sclerotinia trifoliorum]